jgi:2-phosphosulfolactate phosphatase
MLNRIHVAMTPAEAALLPPADCYAVIDVLRATTVMAVLFSRGLRSLRVVETLEIGRAAKTPETILLGDEHGLRPEGFDYGNSPVELNNVDLAGRSAVHVTTNGTRALCTVAPLGRVVATSLVNLASVLELATQGDSICFVCAGNARARLFSLEDFAVAAAGVQRLHAIAPEAHLGDGARLALQLPNPLQLIAGSEHAEATRRLGFAADIEFAMRPDTAPAAPIVTAFGEGWAELALR